MRKTFLLFFLILSTVLVSGQVVVKDDITSDVTWTSSNEYHLDGLIFVDSTVTLTIEAGTVIKGLLSTNITTGDGASALIVRRGAKIMAEGSADNPIIFTSELDDLALPDLTWEDRGLWGGLIILGQATTNQPTTENQIEGIPNELNARYGGNDDEDNSGVLSYISIRHGGFSISGIAGDEINGLTMGAVGSGTQIDHIEVFSNFDDGYEWFGGTVNTKYLVAAFCGDDAYDYDQGFRGKGQYWFTVQGTDEAGRGGEHDGGDDNETGMPYAMPYILNATYIGSNHTSTPAGDGNDRALYFRDNAGGKYYNSIFTEYVGYGVKVEDIEGQDSRKQMEDGNLVLNNNYWWNFGNGNTVSDIADGVDFVIDHLGANDNMIEDPQLRGLSWTTDSGLDPRPLLASPAVGGAKWLEDEFFDRTTFLGAFNPNKNLWTDGWTALYANGHTGDLDGGDAGVVVVSDDISSDETWTANNTYVLDGLIFVDSLATLTIQAGTVIKGRLQSNITTGDGASALIVRRGGMIYAEGTEESPIIFTSEIDNLELDNDLTATDRGLWGGIIVLGSATTNQPTTENQIEGIPNELNARYGGNDDNDNSGVLKFVSIRHGGFSISGIAGDEINGLTMGAVGDGTTIEYIEVFSNFDDGYEWFGGTVNTKYLVAAFCGDDAYDYDQGFRGKGQFWFTIQGQDEAGRGGEHDGGDDNETGMPYAIPHISNVTYIGSGQTTAGVAGDGNDRGIYFRDNAGGKYFNSVFTEYVGYGVKVEDIEGQDSRQQMEDGNLVLNNNYWWNFGNGNTVSDIADGVDFVIDHLGANDNFVEDPQLRGLSWTEDEGLDPRPLFASPAVGGAKFLDDEWFTRTTYFGAFNPNKDLWTNGWTALDAYGFTGDISGGATGNVVITDDISSDVTWTANNTYVLDGLIFVDSLATLTIQAGTVIKGKLQSNITTGDGASALIVRRGGMIYAEGTEESPIIFTSEIDNLELDNDLTATDRGLWGGIIVLGSATTNQPTTENQIEGIPNELNARYGGNNDSDNSGVLKFISIRHGGFSISGIAGDEINGLTMGAVGDQTRIEFIEVFANFDDGYEWFGGTVNTRNLVAAFCGDDAFDYDQGFRGSGQFWFTLQGQDEAGRGGEHDGGDDNETGMPYAMPYISNATYIGSKTTSTPAGDGNDRALYFRDNAGGKYYNSVFTEYVGYGVKVEDIEGQDSRQQMEDGNLVLNNNYWWNFGNGNTVSDIADGVDFVIDHLGANNNTVADPQLRSISWEPNEGLDPRPTTGSPIISGAVSVNDSYIQSVDYLGAFDPDNGIWTEGWTALSAYGYTPSTVVGIGDENAITALPTEYTLSQNYPNPFNPSTKIQFAIPENANVRLSIYNVLGQEIEVLVDELRSAGNYTVEWNAGQMASGMYIYRLQTDAKVLTRKMALLK